MTDDELAVVIRGIAPVVREYVTKAMGDLLPRLAVAESKLELLSDVRDRMVVVETKTETPVAPPIEPVTVDLSPVFERMAAAEARLDVLGDLRDRVVIVETKGAMPPPLAPTVDMAPVLERLNGLDTRITFTTGQAELAFTKEVGALRERVAVLETRAPVAGPSGQDGADGKDGKDGADGLGFDDLSAVQNDDRSLTIKASRGTFVKDIGTVRFPAQIQRGVYIEGKSYEQGDLVTWGGSQWHANEDTTTKPGEGLKAWTLVVKRGRDGKDGRDAPQLPVVSIGGVR